jgi:hypothetical protein
MLEYGLASIVSILQKSNEPVWEMHIVDALQKQCPRSGFKAADISGMLQALPGLEHIHSHGQLCYRLRTERGRRNRGRSFTDENPTERWLRPVRLASAERECSLLERGASLRDEETI